MAMTQENGIREKILQTLDERFGQDRFRPKKRNLKDIKLLSPQMESAFSNEVEVLTHRSMTEDAATPPQTPQEILAEIQEKGMMGFSIAGRKYGLPFSKVIVAGRLSADAWMRKKVETQKGIFQLKDMRQVLGTDGEAGTLYVVVHSPAGKIAWAVDGIDRYPPAQTQQLREFDSSSLFRSRHQICALYFEKPYTPSGGRGHPVYVLNPRILK